MRRVVDGEARKPNSARSSRDATAATISSAIGGAGEGAERVAQN